MWIGKYIYVSKSDETFFYRLTDCVYLNPESYIYEVLRDETSSKMLQALRCQINSMSENIEREYQKKFPVITFLGTGSCIPNKCRNTSAILVSLAYVLVITISFDV